MEYILTSILTPVPVIHFWLHSQLHFWKKNPYYFYIWTVTIWIGSFFMFRYIDAVTPKIFLQYSSPVFLYVGIFMRFIGALMVLSSFYVLGVKRFFLWCVLKPTSQGCNLVLKKGPFEFLPHPAYFGYMLLLLGNFFSSGKLYILVSFAFLFTLMPIVMMLEEEELRARVKSQEPQEKAHLE